VTESPAPSRAAKSEAEPRLQRVVVLAEDLIWATRLSGLLKAAGIETKHARTADDLERALADADADADGVVIDLTARNYDPLAAIERAAAGGRAVACVGQHDDVSIRSRALAAGASRVWTYNQVHTHGPTLVGRWVGRG
jgi:DNA-binding NtrC family response regulator